MRLRAYCSHRFRCCLCVCENRCDVRPVHPSSIPPYRGGVDLQYQAGLIPNRSKCCDLARLQNCGRRGRRQIVLTTFESAVEITAALSSLGYSESSAWPSSRNVNPERKARSHNKPLNQIVPRNSYAGRLWKTSTGNLRR